MSLNELMVLWNHMYIKVMDVRRCEMLPGEVGSGHALPAHAFLFSVRGSAQVQINDVRYTVSRCQLIHGSKGAVLRMAAYDVPFEYYLLYYKAEMARSYRQEIAFLTESSNRLLAPYCFVPHEPVSLLHKLDELLAIWNSDSPDAFRQFQAKTLFHAWVCEMLRQMGEQSDSRYEPDLVGQATRYIYAHYREPITLDSLAKALNYSVPYITKQFKRQTGKSPIDFLIGVRIEKAKELLRRTDTSVQEIAEGVGYADLSYFAKTFKKHTGQTPLQYKENAGGVHETRADRYINRIRSSLVPRKRRNYNFNSGENDYHYNETNKGENTEMFLYEKKGKLAMIMMGIILLLSACSGSGNAAGGAGASNTTAAAALQGGEMSPTETAANEQASQQTWPRTYKGAMGKDIVIEKQPERVVVMHFAMMEYFFALDTPPIASTLADRILSSFETLQPYAESAGVTDIGQVVTPNLELMTELNPDLIVAFAGTHNEAYEDLSKLAPVAMLDTSEMGWREMLREYASLIGKEQLADDYIKDLEALMSEARSELAPYQGKKVTFLRPADNGNTFFVLDESSVEYVYDQELGLGLQSPGEYKTQEEMVSLEGVIELNPDIIFLVDYLDNMDTHFAELGKSKVWNSINAVKEQRVYPLDVSIDAGGPLAIRYVVEKMLEYLTP
ncbi:helix-turn-helix domain-containing protein [Paenibacillus sp. NPDC057967]|uniref:helix-turn-helix domain-containing protein n=1 Tax=Paenibacillus sp. NPDC057967 TaxID=3346293 RepID=UPI0036DCE094